MKTFLRARLHASCWIALAILGTHGPASAQEPQPKDANPEGGIMAQKGEKEIRIHDRRLRFLVRDDWKVQADQGVYAVSAPDNKMWMMLFTLQSTDEIPQAMQDLDALVPVSQAEFGKPRTGLHNGIPTELLFGRGVLTPTKTPVEIATATMNVGGKPVLAVFYVHKDAFDRHFPHVKRTIDSFSLILTEDEAKKLKDKLKALDTNPGR